MAHAVAHLEMAISHLGEARPDFVGRLTITTPENSPVDGKTGLVIRGHAGNSDDNSIIFSYKDVRDAFGHTYDDIEASNFSPHFFMDDLLNVAASLKKDGDQVPIARVSAFFIHGGLILCLYMHHCVADGAHMALFLESLAAATRDVTTLPDTSEVPPGWPFPEYPYPGHVYDDSPLNNDEAFRQLLAQCPEFALNEEPVGPVNFNHRRGGVDQHAIPSAGKVFRFTKDKMEELRSLLSGALEKTAPARPLSSFVCMAALCWSHVAAARLASEHFLRGSTASRLVSTPRSKDHARLLLPVNWKDRNMFPERMSTFGNYIVWAVAETPISLLQEAAVGKVKALAKVASAINRAIRAIDADYVQRRFDLLEACKDPRYLALNVDPRSPVDLTFNTWQFFGADAEWNIPHVPAGISPVIRRCGRWLVGSGLVLPAKKDAQIVETQVMLPEVSMAELLVDVEFVKWTVRE